MGAPPDAGQVFEGMEWNFWASLFVIKNGKVSKLPTSKNPPEMMHIYIYESSYENAWHLDP